MKTKRKRIFKTVSAIVLIVVLLVTSLLRISEVSARFPPVAKSSVIGKNIANYAMGTLYDRNDISILCSDKPKDVRSDLEDITPLSNLLGLDPRYQSSFTVRTLCADTLYGLDQSGFSKNSFFRTVRKGGDVKLTIDTALQTKCYEFIKSHPEYFKNPDNAAGSIVVMNYNTGEVLSLTSYPSFNILDESTYRLEASNDYKNFYIDLNYKNSSALNRCVQKTYMPASCMKSLVYASALTYDPKLKDLTYNCTSKHCYLTCGTPHGSLDMKKALAESCNCYTEYLGSFLPNDTLSKYFRSLGFGEKGVIEKAFGKRLFEYYEGTIDSSTANQQIYSLIGEGSLKTSALSLASMYSALFNHGVMTAPKLVDAKSTYPGENLVPERDAPSKCVFSESAADYVIECMKESVKTGTSNTLSNLSYEVAAKTGTAEENSVAWAVAGFTDKEYLVVVCLENTISSGGKTAAPIAKEVLQYMEENYL